MKMAERVARSKAALTSAVLDLLKGEPAERITITEVCRRADVTRPTFYQHYESVEDLISQVVADRIQQHQDAAFAMNPDGPAAEFEETLGRFLDLIWADRNLVRAIRAGAVTTGVSSKTSIDRLSERILARLPGPVTADARLRARFAAAGTTELLASWLATDEPTELRDTYASLLQDLTGAVIGTGGPSTVSSGRNET